MANLLSVKSEKKKFKLSGTEFRSHFYSNTEYTTVKWSIAKESIALLSVFVLKSLYDNISDHEFLTSALKRYYDQIEIP